MKKNTNQRAVKKILYSGIAFLLLFVFISIPVIEALHHDASTDGKHVSSTVSFKNTEKSIDKQTPVCGICKFISTQQTLNLISLKPIELLVFLKETAIVNTPYLLTAFKTLVHCWTNKGPPSIS